MTDILVIGARGIQDAEGGCEKHAASVFPLFAENGYSITALCLKNNVKHNVYRGMRILGIPSLYFLKTDKLVYHFLSLFYAAITRPKIVHLQGLNSAFFLIFYRLFGLKVVLRYGSRDYQLTKWGFWGRLGFRWCEWQLKFANYVIAVSQTFSTVLVRKYNLKKIDVIPNAIDPGVITDAAKKFGEQQNLKQPYIFAAGRVNPGKDYATLVAAFKCLPDSDVQLVVAGSDDDKEYAKPFFEMNDDRVHFLGRIDRGLIPILYENCSVYVNSSIEEGMSNSILEAISFSKPVIACDIPANVEMDLPDQCYFPVGDSDVLSEKIAQALEDEETFVPDKQKFLQWESVFLKMQKTYQKVTPSIRVK